jgi:hypothetical protein
MKKVILGGAIGAVAIIGVMIPLASANHSWGGYHWARTSNPFTVKLADNVTGAWDSYLSTTSSDWSLSSVLDTSVVSGTNNVKTCKPVAGRVEVCNSKYGANGWLGIASIWISGGHITQGTVKMNDTYFNSAKYNTPAWRNLVMCQEVGHTFGLDHQDEDFSNTSLGSCMDYSNDPTPNQHPNQHDYDMLEQIYTHLDTTTTLSQSAASSGQDVGNDMATWGKAIRTTSDGHGSLYVRDLGKGNKVYTFVTWAK